MNTDANIIEAQYVAYRAAGFHDDEARHLMLALLVLRHASRPGTALAII